MKVITINVSSCKTCPFKSFVKEQGFSGYFCTQVKTMILIEDEILPNCPLPDEKEAAITGGK